MKILQKFKKLSKINKKILKNSKKKKTRENIRIKKIIQKKRSKQFQFDSKFSKILNVSIFLRRLNFCRTFFVHDF